MLLLENLSWDFQPGIALNKILLIHCRTRKQQQKHNFMRDSGNFFQIFGIEYFPK